MGELRSFIFIDQLQPQTLAYIATWMRGSLPRRNMAAQVIEVAPGLDIEALTDVALKGAPMKAGILNRSRDASMLVPGASLLVYEMAPALFARVAANEPERAALNALINDGQMMGTSGRVFMSGTTEDLESAREAITRTLNAIDGRGG